MALKPATKRIRITDESVNSNGFWTLTAGIDVTLYKQNPLLLWNHNRPKVEEASKDDVLPIGIIQDLRIESDGSITGLPAFDDKDPFAMSIYEKYEAGIINMASAGLEPLEFDTDMVKGQDKSWCLSRSILAEVSLTDIGSNKNAVKLYKGDATIPLSDSNDLVKLFFTTNTNKPMLVKLKDFVVLLKLAETASEDDVLEAIKKQNDAIVQLTAGKKTAEDALTDLKKTVNESKITTLVDAAVTEKKILPAEKDKYIKLAGADFDTTKSLLDGMKSYQSVQSQLTDNPEVDAVELAELVKLSAQNLFIQSKMERLKKLSLPHYKVKYKELTGKEFVEETK